MINVISAIISQQNVAYKADWRHIQRIFDPTCIKQQKIPNLADDNAMLCQ